MRRWLDWRVLALALAFCAATASLFRPSLTLPREVYRYLFVIDITQSMKARDYHLEGAPAERLEFAKAAVREVLRELPCGSEAGLGLFTTQNVSLLFEPLEVCEHLPVIDNVLAHIDWRMAWAANSNVTQGLYATIRETARRSHSMRLVFFTDGQETPPLSLRHNFNGKAGEVQGLIVGTGGTRPVTVPRFDRDNRPLGVWENRDIEPPPIASTDYSEKIEVKTLPREGPYLSWLDEGHLKELAATTGLGYHRLVDPDDLSETLLSKDLAERRDAATDLRPYLGAAALALVVLVHGVELIPRKRRTP